MTMGEKIQDLRRRSGMSQDALAEQLGVSRQAVSKWERDEAVPEADKIVSLAKVFHVSTDYLLMDEPAPQAAPAQPQFRSTNSVLRRLERFARRHGYKGGFILSGIGALVCAVSLGLRAIVNSMASNMIGAGNSMMEGMIGGFGSEVARDCIERGVKTPAAIIGIENRFVAHGSVDQLLEECGLQPGQIAQRIENVLKAEKE